MNSIKQKVRILLLFAVTIFMGATVVAAQPHEDQIVKINVFAPFYHAHGAGQENAAELNFAELLRKPIETDDDLLRIIHEIGDFLSVFVVIIRLGNFSTVKYEQFLSEIF